MSRHNHNPSPEYVESVRYIKEFAQKNSLDKAERAVADALGSQMKEAFKNSYGLDKTTTGEHCISRLITGGRCPHKRRRDPPDDPPHKPPHSDHADLWLADGEPAAYTMHRYDLSGSQLQEIVEFADEYELDVRIEPRSWYFPNHTTHVVFLRE